MSGHSHWHSIKYQKALADQKRGKIFSKLSREITIAAKEKGSNPETNPALRVAIERAKKFNMPKANIERAIKRGTGEIKGAQFESVIFEAYGPGGVALIIEGITDNRNRTLSEIKQILAQNNGKLASEGSVKWLFERKGCICIDINSQEEFLKDKETLELKAIEAGAQDLNWIGDILEVYTRPEELEKTKKELEKTGIKIDRTSIDWVAKEKIEVEDTIKEACERLFEDLDENEAVQEIYSNLKQ